jgi:hypothetical protein
MSMRWRFLMDKYICCACGCDGSLTPDEALKNENTLLSEDKDGNLICLVCYMEKENICLHCGEEADLMPDTTCRAEPWLCEECLNLPYRVHMFSCYSDGCMTPEEFSLESLREIEFEEKEQGEKFLDLPESFEENN